MCFKEEPKTFVVSEPELLILVKYNEKDFKRILSLSIPPWKKESQPHKS